MIKIMIVDDHPVMIDGLKSIISKEENMEIIATTSSGKQVLNLLSRNSPDILILDVNLKDMSGLEVAKIVRNEYKNIKILFLTQFDDAWLIGKSIKTGAGAYILKNVSKNELINAIKLAHKGQLNFFFQEGK